MNDPITALLAIDSTTNLAASALPGAPVQPVRTARRRRVLERLRRRALQD
jgi:hypothetical protein